MSACGRAVNDGFVKSRGSDGWYVANQAHIITGPNRGSRAPPGFLGNRSADGAVEEPPGLCSPNLLPFGFCVHPAHGAAFFRLYRVSVYAI